MPQQENFKLDTRNMDAAAAKCEEMVAVMQELRNGLDWEKNEILSVWKGTGAGTFDRKYWAMRQMFTDLSEELRSMAEDIYSAEESYIQADVNLAKALDGVDNPA